MFLSHDCFSIVHKTRPLFSNIQKIQKSKPGPVRCIFRKENTQPKVQKEKVIEQINGLDDDRYSEFFVQYMFSRKAQKESFKNFTNECKKFKEEVTDLMSLKNHRLDTATPNVVDVFFKFEKPEDLDGFSVTTDSSCNSGYSSASFRLTEYETGIFSGNICLDVPKSGTVDRAGFANLSFPKQHMSFFRVRPYDFSKYTHLVLKIRGDGRTYMVILHNPCGYKEIQYSMYCSQLFTRGGPYWQIAKLPLYHFSHSLNGKMFDLQSAEIPLIEKLSITAAGYEGPFKLEIDYVGFEFKQYEKAVSPYERYKMK